MVEEDAKLVRGLNADYADVTADGGLDTVEGARCSISSADASPPESRDLAVAAWMLPDGSWQTFSGR